MPDMTIEAYWCCETAQHWRGTIDGHAVYWGSLPPSADVGYGFVCDCTGFKYRKQCRHVKAAEALRCGWQQFVSGGEPVDGKCPRCGGGVSAERYAV